MSAMAKLAPIVISEDRQGRFSPVIGMQGGKSAEDHLW
jgi:hypothetical protein